MTIPRWDRPLLTTKNCENAAKGAAVDVKEQIGTFNEALAALNAWALELQSRIAQNVASLQS